MRRSARDYDESDVRVRPSRRGSRPRTKDRPRHEDAITARVVSVDRGRWHTVVDAGTDEERTVIAMRARELGRSPVVPGDLVGLVGDTSGRDGSLARIVRIRERSSFLRRSADDDDATERPLVANVDLMVMVTAVADPEPRGGMIDRCLVAAYVAGVDTLLVLTKADLRSPEEFLRTYAPLGLEHVVTAVEGGTAAERGGGVADSGGAGTGIRGLEELRRRLAGHVSVLVGHSGVGKSTLLNALVPGTDRATGVVNDVTGRGRHTSSSALAMQLPQDDGWVIDTPGVRSFGLGHVDPEELLEAFTDLAALAESCPRGCTHLETAPDCALDDLVDAGDAGSAGPVRLASYRRLAVTLRRNDPWEL
ncbi:ribosome small subunit-dependent GTPase A [Brachybacterium sp. P6-10-X1]|uniref:ribosome small subunit-dependent GTPase A n=1 Tax=Brachybacterium sp. P6-10-X1 TaxID=1903186 RepID=UPI0009717EB1|nr:ribosome small subunit-dependent GTPase A [Brachybacterium sp. P6-10-X1]APX32310.1 ribosome small subunit-dependent GTPase A [Brachybacterium sp. P6-10-X1]